MMGREEKILRVALAGNPNVGKSTLFNALTGLHQHTGNWPGKTVGLAQGTCRTGDTVFHLTDLPGTYSLTGNSQEEILAADYLHRETRDCTVVVCDGSCLERSLILTLQILMCCHPVVVCVNLMDEARRRGMEVDEGKLRQLLGVPVVLTAAGSGWGTDQLLETVCRTVTREPAAEIPRWEDPVAAAESIAAVCVTQRTTEREKFRHQVERLLVSRRFGMGLMVLTLLVIIWLTVWGANYPSQLLEQLFDRGYVLLSGWMAPWPWWLRGILADGLYATSTRVISVMLPPMAIFFPLFTILEDIGYLPRMAFLMDPCMARCGGCGKQALTLCMGLGCNAVGVMGCRIIDSPRERLAAILTNAMMPCNGRFPTLILLGSLFFPEAGAALVVAACVALGAVGAMAVSGLLGRTVLRAKSSTFVMEMPPFRRPRLGKILVRSLLDRTLFVAGRAMAVAAPAGVVLWCLSHFGILTTAAAVLEPVGRFLGMNGVILLAFVCALPANELLIPVILMILQGAGSLYGVERVGAHNLLLGTMNWQMALCTMVFTLFHWPCTTTLMSIYRETGSLAKTAAAFALPTLAGVTCCAVLQLLLQYFGA